MELSRILAAAGMACGEEREITGVTCRSGEVKPGNLFVALEGHREDGRKYIPAAVEAGAAAVICRGKAPAAVPVICCSDPRLALGPMAAEFFGRPGDGMTMIAVTGTKGKTTTACMLRSILTAAGRRPGMMGTLGAFIGEEKVADAVNTTPEPVALHGLLRQMEDAGCTHVVMEASSQALKHGRLNGLTFDVGVFLNLSPDHIGPGEHESYEEYRNCKGELFALCRAAVGNGEDPAWPSMAARLPEGAKVRIFGGGSTRPGPGLSTLIRLPGREEYTIPMPGEFNGQNAMAAIAAAELLGIPDEAVRAGLHRAAVPGRCMVYPADVPYGILLDYAHNGASFAALFAALRQRSPGRIIAVFGAGGNRSPVRRYDLGRAAAAGADFAVLTSDNPRWERAEDICAQIASALDGLPHAVIPDRREAIRYALDMAAAGDVVTLLGKGHEEYMEEQGVKRHFSEWEVLEEYFSIRNYLSSFRL